MRRAALPLAAVTTLLLAGCTPTVSLTPAPRATSVGCATVVVRLPAAVGGLARRTTDAQGTAAWGPDPAVTLVCGVRQTVQDDRCVTVGGVQWSSPSANPVVDGRIVVPFTTFGRDPAVQVVSPVVDRTTRVTADTLLPAVSEAVRAGTRATGERCGAGTRG